MYWGFLARIINRAAPILIILREKLDILKLKIVEVSFDLSEIFDCDIFEEFISENPSIITKFELIQQ